MTDHDLPSELVKIGPTELINSESDAALDLRDDWERLVEENAALRKDVDFWCGEAARIAAKCNATWGVVATATKNERLNALDRATELIRKEAEDAVLSVLRAAMNKMESIGMSRHAARDAYYAAKAEGK